VVAVKRFWMQENGQGTVEYGLVIVFVAGALLVVLGQLGDFDSGVLTAVSGNLTAGS